METYIENMVNNDPANHNKYEFWMSRKGPILVSEMNDKHIANAINLIKDRLKTAFYDKLEEIREANGWIIHLKSVLRSRHADWRDASIAKIELDRLLGK